MTVTKWGKAGVRLTEKEIEQRGRAATVGRNRRTVQRAADDRTRCRHWLLARGPLPTIEERGSFMLQVEARIVGLQLSEVVDDRLS